jgi:hypothetical protein
VPEASVPVSAETGPIVVPPQANDMPELSVKRTTKRKAFVLVPPAPYRLHEGSQSNRANYSTFVPSVTRDELQPTVNKPEQSNRRSYENSSSSVPLVTRDELPSQPTVNKPDQSNRGSQANCSTSVPLVAEDELRPKVHKPEQSNRGSQAKSSTSVPLVARDDLQPTVNSAEQRGPSSQVDAKVPKTLSDIGISIPTTVRKPGSFIIHTLPHIITQATEHLVDLVTPRTKPPHVGNPVTAQVITKGSISTLKFKKSIVKSSPSSSNNTAAVVSTDSQGDPKSSKLPQSQPKPPMPQPEVSNDVTELAAQSIANKVMDRVDFMLVSYFILFFIK